jgi:hypothetical protein
MDPIATNVLVVVESRNVLGMESVPMVLMAMEHAIATLISNTRVWEDGVESHVVAAIQVISMGINVRRVLTY